VRIEHPGALAPAVNPPVIRTQLDLAARVEDLRPSSAEVSLGLGEQRPLELRVVAVGVDYEHRDGAHLAVDPVRRAGRRLGAESGVDEARESAILLGQDQAVGLEMEPAEHQFVELVGAQGADDLPLGEGPIPEVGQGGRVAVAEGSEADHRAFGARG
jgi:hypothetical protein